MPELITALGDTKEEVRSGAAETLGQIGLAAAGAISALKNAVNDPDQNVAQVVQAALERIQLASSAAPS